MKLAKRIDIDGFFVEDVISYDVDNLDSDLILDDVPQGLHRPKWNGTAWVEGKPQVEIDALFIEKENAAAKADLIQIDIESVRSIREYIASQPNAPQFLLDKESAAQAARARIK